jgi:hypothetical protein
MQPKNYITTYKKHRFSPLNPQAEDIDIEDIAHALSLMCRANGHFARFFSIARHCVNCCREGMARRESREVLLALLLHDAAEAYISDLTRPVKIGLPEYVQIEERLQAIIWQRFNVIPTEAVMKTVQEIDDIMLKAEFKHFAGEEVATSAMEPVAMPDFSRRTFGEDEDEFLKVFNHLTKSDKM